MNGIFKGLFKPSYGYIRAIVAIVLGVCLIIWPNSTPETLIMIMGLFLVATGIVSIVSSLIHKKKDDKSNVDISILNGIVVLVIGGVLAIWPGTFINFIFIIIGILLLIEATSMLVALIRAKKYIHGGWLAFVLPVLTIAAACFVLFYHKSQSITFIVIGVSLLIYGLSELVTAINVGKAMKEEKIEEQKAEVTNSTPAAPGAAPAAAPSVAPTAEPATPASTGLATSEAPAEAKQSTEEEDTAE